MKNSLIDNQGLSLPHEKKPKLEVQILASQGIFKLNFTVCLENPTYLKDFQCPHCNCYLTDGDINQNNYSLWVSNEVSEITKENNLYGLGDGRPAYEMNFRLRMAEHRICR